MAQLTANDVAKYFLAQLDEDQCGDTLSNLKLQKLLYYAQGFSLAILDRPLFTQKILAWAHGPVVPAVYYEYKHHGSNAIPKPKGFSFNVFSNEQRELLDEVYEVFGQFSAWKLRNMTHEEPPWKNTRKNGVITRASMKEYFKTLMVDD